MILEVTNVTIGFGPDPRLGTQPRDVVEPRPLIGVLAAQGFSAKITPIEGGDFAVIFSAPAHAEGDEEPLL